MAKSKGDLQVLLERIDNGDFAYMVESPGAQTWYLATNDDQYGYVVTLSKLGYGGEFGPAPHDLKDMYRMACKLLEKFKIEATTIDNTTQESGT